MTKPKYGLDRVAFNRNAKELRADDNLPGLKVLAVNQVFPRPGKGRPAEDLWQTLASAAMGAVVEWWTNGGNLPHDGVHKAIAAAARDFRGQGNGAVDVTWRGPYSTDKRQFLSHPKQWTPAAAVALTAVMDNTERVTEAPAQTESDDRDQRDAERDALAAFAVERAAENRQTESGAVASGAAVLEASAERTSHDGGHADDVRLNPRDDGESAYGVDEATRGVGTGSMVPSAYLIAWQMALAERPRAQGALLLAFDRAGGFDNYVNKDGHRKRARAALEAQRNEIERECRQRAEEILESAGDIELQTAWLCAQPKERGYRTVQVRPGVFRAEAVAPPPTGGASSSQGGVLSAAWPGVNPGRRYVQLADLECAISLASWKKDLTATAARDWRARGSFVHVAGVPPLSKWNRWDWAGQLRRQRDHRAWLLHVAVWQAAGAVVVAPSLLDG